MTRGHVAMALAVGTALLVTVGVAAGLFAHPGSDRIWLLWADPLGH